MSAIGVLNIFSSVWNIPLLKIISSKIGVTIANAKKRIRKFMD